MCMHRAVASLTVPGGQEFHFPHFSSNCDQFFLNFSRPLLIFFLIQALRVGNSPTREGPGYATGCAVGPTPLKTHYLEAEELVYI